ncbi:hypothetical protein G3I40_03290 [Streptomyces sp. SID14478]|uniref:hypothetical protein n=1 Tax=Streptomyces sp. SID14478 TaxID=2706073 RepID=UPI0013DC3709|nr:hypothetical protein [Streptomyces sp. SID14478]NEB74270.1 hypothetical protein [Streptomyces sp. SID14478]
MPEQRGLSPVNGPTWDGSDAVRTSHIMIISLLVSGSGAPLVALEVEFQARGFRATLGQLANLLEDVPLPLLVEKHHFLGECVHHLGGQLLPVQVPDAVFAGLSADAA